MSGPVLPRAPKRPGVDSEQSSSDEPDGASSDNDGEQGEQDDEEIRRQQLEAALRKHQMQFLQDSNLMSAEREEPSQTATAKDTSKGKEVKSVWDLGMDDLEDEDEDDEEEQEDDESGSEPEDDLARKASKRRGLSFPPHTASRGVFSRRD